MSLKIDEYLSYSGAVSDTLMQRVASAAKTSDGSQEDSDSYVSSVETTQEAIPCENYNDILNVIQSTKAELYQSQDSAEESGQSGVASQAVSGAAGGSGDGSDSEDETTSQIVVINGITYLETTTVQGGVTTVQRTVIKGQGNTAEEL